MIFIKTLSLYNGISCGRVASDRAGIHTDRYVSFENDNNANKIAKKNYPNDEYNGDVFDGDFTKYRGFDLLIGGSPCTYWSISQKPEKREVESSGLGWDLFKQYVRALKESQCKYFLYENNYSISQEIKKEITKALGVDPIMINSSCFSAQNRRREYWTNIPVDSNFADSNIYVKDILDYDYRNENLYDEVVFKRPNRIDKSKTIRIGTIGKGGARRTGV